MSGRKRELSGEEKDLWRRVTASAKPKRRQEITGESGGGIGPKKLTRSQLAPERRPSPPPDRKHQTPPQDRSAERRVRRGALEIDATLDLHGHTQDSGRIALARFLQRASARGDRVVVVVTGVGRGGEGVLKRRLPDWLADPELRGVLSGFSQAHRAHGGAGAFYVFLKRRR